MLEKESRADKEHIESFFNQITPLTIHEFEEPNDECNEDAQSDSDKSMDVALKRQDTVKTDQ
ncbi:hypothetical protein KIN20_029783 [Parelaphostrongylus tenuis]|uniref:Uncharacterized protein n=1 Tax=Parelaphostrongylus tenuis TaxID=148309 RepID=A0AAD5WFQ8_PARTN|nr:hypothetical protein KIN20_029783 [Parelaphostrongylus tenuis]